VRRYFELKEKGLGYHTVANEIGVSHQAIKLWVDTWKVKGDAGFPRKKPRPRHNPLRLDRVLAREALSGRDIATIRYAMVGLSDAQVAAYFGRSGSYIAKVRRGEKGGQIVGPVTPPATRSRIEADLWFLAMAKEILKAWTQALDRIAAEGDAAEIDDLLEGRHEDAEPHLERPRRRNPNDRRGRQAHDQGAVDATSGRGDQGANPSHGDLPAGRPIHPGGDHPPPSPGPRPAEPLPAPAGGPGKSPDAPPAGWLTERRRR
jgi:transposase